MIQFEKDLANDKHLWVFNNNVIKFYDDTSNTSTHADIVTSFFSVRIYPDPFGRFSFNFKKHVKALAVVNNLSDVINFNLNNTLESLVYNDTSNVVFNMVCEISIALNGSDTQFVDKSYQFISGVEQIIAYQKQEHPQTKLFLLQNPLERTRHAYHINYWEGYPFDISIYSQISGNMKVINKSNTWDIDIPIEGGALVNRFAFADGHSEVTINDFLPLKTGWNRLQITRPGYNSENNVDEIHLGDLNSGNIHFDEVPLDVVINKHDAQCGVYIKFRSEKGGWTYWLFHKNIDNVRSNSKLDNVANDFQNIEDTTSPIIHSGVKESKDRIRCFAIGVTELDMRTLEYLIDSPKVYLFTGTRFGVNNEPHNKQWVEIDCLTSSIPIKKMGYIKQNIEFNFELPIRNKVNLL